MKDTMKRLASIVGLAFLIAGCGGGGGGVRPQPPPATPGPPANHARTATSHSRAPANHARTATGHD